MSKLNKFTFSIDTIVCNKEFKFELPSNEDMQRSFIGRGYQQVASYVHSFSMSNKSKCHVYSLPYDFDYFVNLDNSFQGGIFPKIRYLNMKDAQSFEHRFFQLISKDFSHLEFLYISNICPQKYKQHSSTLITFPCLILLNLKFAHVDYAEQFLLRKNAHLPRLSTLCIQYESLTTITNIFTNDATNFNFATLKSVDLCQSFTRPENFYEYFPFIVNRFNKIKCISSYSSFVKH